MTYGPDNPGPTDPQYPYGYGWPPPHAQPYPPPPSNKMATWSIVFAFLFAPIGAVLGHFALADIRDRHERGRDRAVLGLTLSYAVIVIAAGALLVWAIHPANSVSSTIAAPMTTSAPSTSTSTATPTPSPTTTQAPSNPVLGQADLPRVLLSLDEVKAIMKTPNLAPVDYSGGGPGGGSGTPGGRSGAPEPPAPPCFDAIMAGLDTSYNGADFTGYKGAHFMDATTATIIDEVVTTFDDHAAAQRFVAHLTDIWSRCSGQTVTLPTPAGSPSVALVIGNVTATTDGAALQNKLAGKSFTQYRTVALKDNVVVDLGAMGLQLTTDQPATIKDQILARIPG
ncbi:sensor domain-containing protein [Mycolicibacterium komossense]|uniref:Sensor domain-containing protein n=1 Tax=Mycolicibacterium komossense TaxID=1779 RepID=A0ABT3C7H7_9MYCO|nr:sensor domain-containing protein [Mycolicibacterium komossense]MCV7225380.1 sensor domain-containing protein [Mycolicibacterium komossense]